MNDHDALSSAEREVHTAYIELRVALERLHHVLTPPGTMQGDTGTLDRVRVAAAEAAVAASEKTGRPVDPRVAEMGRRSAPSFDPAWDKTPEEIARIQALPNRSRLT